MVNHLYNIIIFRVNDRFILPNLESLFFPLNPVKVNNDIFLQKFQLLHGF